MNNNTYWANNGKYDKAQKELCELIPITGCVDNPRSKNKKLEKFRKASNCYYDLYNNGLCNRAAQFAKIFGIPSRNYGNYSSGYISCLYDEVELEMNSIIEAAALEQGFESLLK
jgi:hypothetical protein